jgi:formylglycine-generating enzyme required for sulfatase activity
VALFLVGGWWTYGELRARALVDTLLASKTAAVPELVHDLGPYRRWADPLLREQASRKDLDEGRRLNLALALLPSDASQIEYLRGRLLGADPDEAVAIRELLAPYRESLAEPLWAVLEDRAADPARRLRIACALAAYAPGDARWEQVSGDVAARLMAEHPLAVSRWAEALRPVGRWLSPALATLLQEERLSSAERRTLTGVYACSVEGVPDAFLPLEEVLAEEPGPGADTKARVALARRQANAAVALAAMGRWEKVWPLMRHTPDPTLRTYLLDRLGRGGADFRALIDRLTPGREPDVSARRAVLLALGEFDRDQLSMAERKALVPRLLELYRDDPDSGTHGMAGWLLCQWGQQESVAETDRRLATGKLPASRGWYVNRQGQTMVVVPPGQLSIKKDKEREWLRVGRSFAIAAREVSSGEFRRFRKDHPRYEYEVNARESLRFRKDYPQFEQYAGMEALPVSSVLWYDAAAYCNWLSNQEGIPREQWCYEPAAAQDGKAGDDFSKERYAAGMKLRANFLSLSGYRLPTAAEWEYACRAGSITMWSIGEAEDLFGKYAWHVGNSGGESHPCGRLRPNDLGLFDMHGNVWEWCGDSGRRWGEDPTDVEINDATAFWFLGGAHHHAQWDIIANSMAGNLPTYHGSVIGFRPARTCP